MSPNIPIPSRFTRLIDVIFGYKRALAAVRELPRGVWIICAGTFLNKFGSFVVPFLTLYLTTKGFSLVNAGLAVGCYGIGNLFASILGGFLADRIGRRKTIVISMIAAGITMTLLGTAHQLWAIFALTALTGLASELYRPASSALIADLVPPENRVTAFCVYRIALNAGWAFGPATAGFLVKYSFSWLFVGDAMTSLLYAIVAVAWLPEGLRTARQEAHWATALKGALSNFEFLKVLASSFLIGLMFFQMSSTFGVHVINQGLSAEVYGRLISFNGLLIVLFELPVSTWTQKLKPQRIIPVGYSLVGIGFGIAAFAHDVWSLLFSVIVFTIGEMLSIPIASAYAANMCPANARGRYLGLVSMTWSLALVVGPSVGLRGLAWNPAAFWLLFSTCGFLAAWVISTSKIKQPA
ncbi:MAG: Major facilitator transporter [Verrucomicrobiales bacterium]|nr:Major facilitator transporter [Verrucomicrobiales bacterium]